MSHKIKLKIILCSIVGVCIGLISSQKVYAANGSLSINHQVISETAKDKDSNTISQEVPGLFLSDKTNEVKKIQSEEQAKIEQAKAVIFTGNKAIKDEDGTNTNAQLFTTEWTDDFSGVMFSQSKDEKHSSTIPNGLLLTLMLGMGVIAIVAGVILGKKYARWFK